MEYLSLLSLGILYRLGRVAGSGQPAPSTPCDRKTAEITLTQNTYKQYFDGDFPVLNSRTCVWECMKIDYPYTYVLYDSTEHVCVCGVGPTLQTEVAGTRRVLQVKLQRKGKLRFVGRLDPFISQVMRDDQQKFD